MSSQEGSKRSPYRLSKTPEFSVRNSFQSEAARARTTHVPGPRQLVKHPRLLTTIRKKVHSTSRNPNPILARSRSVNDDHFEDIDENLSAKNRQITIEDRIMELLIASKRQLKPNSRRQKRNPLALETNKIFDQEIVEKSMNKKPKIGSSGSNITRNHNSRIFYFHLDFFMLKS